MKNRNLLLPLVNLLLLSTAPVWALEPVQRVWTIQGDPDISYEGTPILIEEDRVILEYKDGKRHFEVAPDRLSKEDQDLLRQIGPLNRVPTVNMTLEETYIQDSEDTSGPTTPVPVVTSDYWQIAPKAPDLGEHNSAKNITAQDACDFTIWQDAAGHWNLVSCIRSVANNDKELNRLFYHWRTKGTSLEEQFWEPQGIFLMPHPELGEGIPGAIQAPHVVQHDGKYYMFYSSGQMYCLISNDGITWERQLDCRGEPSFFKMGRDVMVFHDKEGTGKWYAYYTTNQMVQRRADDPLGPWSEEEFEIGNTGNPESPFILRHNGKYYLWEQMNVYLSDSPEIFDGPQITFTEIPPYKNYKEHLKRIVYATEIIKDQDGQLYIAGYSNGIFLAKLGWVNRTPEDMRDWWQTVGLPHELDKYQREYEDVSEKLKANPDHAWNKFVFERARRNLEVFPKLDYKYLNE